MPTPRSKPSRIAYPESSTPNSRNQMLCRSMASELLRGVLGFRQGFAVQRPLRADVEQSLAGGMGTRVYRMRTLLNLVVQDVEPHPEEQRIDHTEHRDGGEHLPALHRFRDCVTRQQSLGELVL